MQIKLTSFDKTNTITIPTEVYPRLAEAISSVLTAIKTGLAPWAGSTTLMADLRMLARAEGENPDGTRGPIGDPRAVELREAIIDIRQHAGWSDTIVVRYDPDEADAPMDVMTSIESDTPYIDDHALPELRIVIDDAERLIVELHDAARLARKAS
jgi:hypothetical protein